MELSVFSGGMVEFYSFLVCITRINTVSIAKEISKTLDLLKLIYLSQKCTPGQTNV